MNILANEIIENEKTLIASCAAQGSSGVTVTWASDDEEIQNQIDQLDAVSKMGHTKGTYCLKGRCFLRLWCGNFAPGHSDWSIKTNQSGVFISQPKQSLILSHKDDGKKVRCEIHNPAIDQDGNYKVNWTREFTLKVLV